MDLAPDPAPDPALFAKMPKKYNFSDLFSLLLAVDTFT
jgi:hypothetical protein